MTEEEEYEEYPQDFQDRFSALKAQWKTALKKKNMKNIHRIFRIGFLH
jgi:hypothetical protein